MLVDAAGALRRCSRTENRELFQLAIGGYGLFGVITSVDAAARAAPQGAAAGRSRVPSTG